MLKKLCFVNEASQKEHILYGSIYMEWPHNGHVHRDRKHISGWK